MEAQNTNDAYIGFSNMLNESLNNWVKEKIIVSRTKWHPWTTNGLRNLNKLFRKTNVKDKLHPLSMNFFKYRIIYKTLKRKAKILSYDKIVVQYRYDTRMPFVSYGVYHSLIARTNDKTRLWDTFKIKNNIPPLISRLKAFWLVYWCWIRMLRSHRTH